mgnify:CR=1 FL=1
MARFNFETADKYGGNGSSNYFSLKDDKDTARVRFMYNSEEDIEGYAVHEVEIDGRKRYVNCIRDYDEPVDNCPFCKARVMQKAKLFVPLYDVDEDNVKVWERGKNYMAELIHLCSKHATKAPLVSSVFDITRIGKKGDPKTRYITDKIESDDTQLEDLPEIPQILGTFVLDKTYDEMQEYLETGSFPSEDSEPVRRRDRQDTREERPVRRTPNRTGKNYGF